VKARNANMLPSFLPPAENKVPPAPFEGAAPPSEQASQGPTEGSPLLASLHAKPPAAHKGRRLAVFLDGSFDSERALHQAMEDKKPDDILFLVTIVEEYTLAPAVGLSADAMQTVVEANKTLREKTAHKLQSVASKLHERGVTGLYLRVPYGVESSKVQAVQFAADYKLDIAYVGCRGLGAVKRLFLGSFSDYLTHNINCTLVVVKVDPNARGTSLPSV